jgi:hypothetical protein
MARSTGPGKIRVLKLLDSGPPGVLRIPDNIASATSFQAVLYNFDIDGDVLKREHKEWLKEHVVPQLGDPQVKIELRGEASRSGSDAHNLDLSKRRVAQVMSFFRANGPVLANVADTAAGEADAAGRGENDNTEDALVRAVVVKVEQSLHRLVPPVFDSFGSPAGFDPGADPPWVMIPTGSLPRIMQVDNAEGLSLVATKPGVALPQPALFRQDGPVKITSQSKKFRIVGGLSSERVIPDAEIRAVDVTGRVHARLAVSVLPPLTVKCAFHYVQNPRYGTRTRHLGDETEVVRRLNDIWESQANIRFEQASAARDLTMTEDLGDAIDTQAKFDAVTRHRRPGAQFNVFFVREMEANPNVGDVDDARTVIGPPGDCVFEDNSALDLGLLISHEAGHCLTLDHDDPIPATNDMLMNHTPRNSFVPRVHVLQARRAVRR